MMKITGKKPCFIGTYSNGIQSSDYDYYETSFAMVDYKVEDHID